MSKLYSDLKMFHYQQKLDSLPPHSPITAPLHIRFKPTNICNHTCRYCSYRDPDHWLGKDMSTIDSIPYEKCMELVHDFVDMGVKAVTFSGGGEPLLYPHLLDASRILVDGGVKLACLTNGALLCGKIADFFAHHATWIRVSMDGWDNASYQRYRSVSDGEFDKIIDNIRNFINIKGSCLLGISYIVDAENYTHVRDMLEMFKDIGVRSVKVSACVVSNDVHKNNVYHAPYFHKTHSDLYKAINDLSDENFEIIDAWHTLSDRFIKSYTWCPYIQINPVIAADMGVYPCHDKAYVKEFCLSSLKNQSFKRFWLNEKNTLLKLNPHIDCRHHCMVNEKNKMLLEYLDIDYCHCDFV